MAAKQVKVRILRDCEGPGNGYKAGDETTVSATDAEILRRRGFGEIISEAAPAAAPAEKK